MQRESLRGLTSAEVAERVATGRASDVPSAPDADRHAGARSCRRVHAALGSVGGRGRVRGSSQAGGVNTGRPSVIVTVQSVWWITSWWWVQSSTRFSRAVGPPSAQCWMWCNAVQLRTVEAEFGGGVSMCVFRYLNWPLPHDCGMKAMPASSRSDRFVEHVTLGVLMSVLDRDLIDEILLETGRREQRVRLLPAESLCTTSSPWGCSSGTPTKK